MYNFAANRAETNTDSTVILLPGAFDLDILTRYLFVGRALPRSLARSLAVYVQMGFHVDKRG